MLNPICRYFNRERKFVNRKEIARQILEYIARHPAAQDTLEGILEWWLLEQQIRYQKDIIQLAVDDLVRSGLLVEQRIENETAAYYYVNRDRRNEIFNELQR
jgi:hypothetical protein